MVNRGKLQVFTMVENSPTLTESHRKLRYTYEEHAPPVKICEYGFRRFKIDDFDLNDKERFGQHRIVTHDKIWIYFLYCYSSCKSVF